MVIKNDKFVNSLNDLELRAWILFVEGEKNFWGNRRAKNYKKLMEKLLKSLQDIGAMSIKVHFLHSNLDEFPNNCCEVRDEQGEQFHQDTMTMEERHQRRWLKQMMTDYCWGIKIDLNNTEHWII